MQLKYVNKFGLSKLSFMAIFRPFFPFEFPIQMVLAKYLPRTGSNFLGYQVIPRRSDQSMRNLQFFFILLWGHHITQNWVLGLYLRLKN